jgi:hypothetical protein
MFSQIETAVLTIIGSSFGAWIAARLAFTRFSREKLFNDVAHVQLNCQNVFDKHGNRSGWVHLRMGRLHAGQHQACTHHRRRVPPTCDRMRIATSLRTADAGADGIFRKCGS